MFDKYGEFNGYEEINRAAAAQLAEGDTDAVKGIAAENGISEFDAEDYIDGVVPDLCNARIAAIGKIDIETADLKPYEIECDWIEYIKAICIENEDIARAVRAKGKSIKGCIAYIIVWSFKNAKDVDEDIIKAAGISAQRVSLGIPGIATAKKLIREYYGGIHACI